MKITHREKTSIKIQNLYNLFLIKEESFVMSDLRKYIIVCHSYNFRLNPFIKDKNYQSEKR